jgi:ABC-type phosphate transport system substrate-binding protein
MKQILVVLIVTALLGFGAASQASADDVAVIVHKSNPVDSLTMGELRKIVMGTQAKWPNEQKISVLMTTPGQPERETTLKVVCGMNETNFNLHFTHASFNEGLANLRGPKWSQPAIAELPTAVGSGVQVRQSVAGSANAVGFIKASQLDGSVKVIKIDGSRPGEPAYKLKLK